MTQKQLHKDLGNLYGKLNDCIENGKYNEKLIQTAKTMAGVAKQMIQSADVSIRASKILHNNDILKGVFTDEEETK